MNKSFVSFERIYVILNPIAGHADVEKVRAGLEKLSQARGWQYQVYETTGDENVSEIAGQACRDGAQLVVAAGGDGTIAAVVNGLVHTGIPLGVIPVGTGNGLARAMQIPLDLNSAIQLLAGDYILQDMDAMQVDSRHFVLNVSAGISARSMQETETEEKQKFGMLAYAKTIIQDALENEPSLFTLTLDGIQVQVRASEVLVSNGEVLKEPPLIFGACESFADGRMEVNILTASKPTEYLRLAWDLLVDPDHKNDVHDMSVREKITLEIEGEPQPVQADGEVIGQTPVEIQLVRNALQVLVPPAAG